MVQLTRESIVITIPAAGNQSAENWLVLHKQLCLLLSYNQPETAVENPWMVLELLDCLMPDEKTANKLIQ